MSVQLHQQYEPEFPIDTLLPHPKNPRQHDEEALDESIEETGFAGSILVQKSTGFILDGHGRVNALRRKGEATVPVMVVDVDDAMALKILLNRNRTADKASYDDEALTELLDSLAEVGELYGTGYSADDLDDLLAKYDDGTVLPEQEFQGGYVEQPEQLAKRAERKTVTQQSVGLREIMLVLKEDDYERARRAIDLIGAFHECTSTSETVLAALVNYGLQIEQDLNERVPAG